MDSRMAGDVPKGLRTLARSDMEGFLAHLLRLDAESRRDRFNGVVSDAFLRGYAGRCLSERVTVVAAFVDGKVMAAGELHWTADGEAEAAFSVEKPLRGKGVGGMLFDRVVEEARARGVARIGITTHADNLAMRALARSRGIALAFAEGEGMGWIEVPRPAEGLAAA